MKPYKYARIFELASSQKLAMHINTPQEQKLHENEIWQANFTLLAKFISISLSFLSLQVTFAQHKYQPASHLG